MSPLLLPFQLVLLMFARRVNRHQPDVIEHWAFALRRTRWSGSRDTDLLLHLRAGNPEAPKSGRDYSMIRKLSANREKKGECRAGIEYRGTSKRRCWCHVGDNAACVSSST